ncbi:MAG: hypothetical protein HQL31_06770 [Planctomycetes bacterium]|nr:hypothetical protein [Planctomycetota bacterium]
MSKNFTYWEDLVHHIASNTKPQTMSAEKPKQDNKRKHESFQSLLDRMEPFSHGWDNMLGEIRSNFKDEQLIHNMENRLDWLWDELTGLVHDISKGESEFRPKASRIFHGRVHGMGKDNIHD